MIFLPEYNKRTLNGIYIIRNTINKKVYIGECINFYKRYGRHKSALLNNKHCNIKLLNFVNKYGIDKLIFDILEIIDSSEHDILVNKEIEYIQKYNSIKNGFNIILDSRTMQHVTNKDRQKGSKKLKGIKRDEDFCNAVKEGLRLYYENHPKQQRKKWTEERKQRRIEYIKLHKEKYLGRKCSKGNTINHKRGKDSPFTSLNELIVFQIKKNMKNNIKRSITLLLFNITVNIYKDILRGKTWKHVKIE